MDLLAQNPEPITNPVIGAWGQNANLTGTDAGSGSGLIIAQIIVYTWRSIITIGGLAVLLWIIYGGLTWLTAGGSKEKLENARNRIVNAIIGMAILFASAAFVNFLGPAIGFDLLELKFPTPTTQPTTPNPGGINTLNGRTPTR